MNTPSPAPERKLLYVDGSAGYRLSLRSDSLEVQRRGSAARLIPVRRVERVILREPESELFQALLRLVREGAAVHFQSGEGELVAALTPMQPPASLWAQELAWQIQRNGSRQAYPSWRDTQLRHAMSLILRRAPNGPITLHERRVALYVTGRLSPADAETCLEELRSLLEAWVHARLQLDGASVVVEALHAHRANLPADLVRCLFLPLLWRLAPHIREHGKWTRWLLHEHIRSHHQLLDTTLLRHLAALSHHFRGTALHWNSHAGTGT